MAANYKKNSVKDDWRKQNHGKYCVVIKHDETFNNMRKIFNSSLSVFSYFSPEFLLSTFIHNLQQISKESYMTNTLCLVFLLWNAFQK